MRRRQTIALWTGTVAGVLRVVDDPDAFGERRTATQPRGAAPRAAERARA
jgi:hypothetical protein